MCTVVLTENSHQHNTAVLTENTWIQSLNIQLCQLEVHKYSCQHICELDTWINWHIHFTHTEKTVWGWSTITMHEAALEGFYKSLYRRWVCILKHDEWIHGCMWWTLVMGVLWEELCSMAYHLEKINPYNAGINFIIWRPQSQILTSTVDPAL